LIYAVSHKSHHVVYATTRFTLTDSDRLKYLPGFISKMEKDGLPPLVIDTFAYYYEKIVEGETGFILDRDITPLTNADLYSAEELTDYTDDGRRALRKTVKITLNGGLGTSMGLIRAKSLIKVKDDKSFLEIILKEGEKRYLKIALMNSFSTHADTLAAVSKLNLSNPPLTFLQHRFPKITRDHLTPAEWSRDPFMEWNPPGHGDVYAALYTSGTLRSLLDQGIEYAFISNSDNLGAVLDDALLGFFAKHTFSFMMEVAQKTPADIKGGHLARDKKGRLILRESIQCPENEIDAFQDIGKYRFFNTNNIWVNLEFLMDFIEKHHLIRLPMILNPKTLDPRDEASPAVFQLETAMGSAISLFEKATVVDVPRSRFLPVKKCNELLAVQSDCFIISDRGTLILNPKRDFDKITIDLDPKHFGRIEAYHQRFPAGIPSLVDCRSFTVTGDVLFEKNVVARGQVVIRNKGHRQAIITEGTVLEGDYVLSAGPGSRARL